MPNFAIPGNRKKMLRRYAYLSLLILLLLLLYARAIREFVYDWYHDENYSHGFLIPLISAFLVWKERVRLKETKYSSSNFGLLVLFAGLLFYIIGTAGAEWFITRSSLIIVIAGLVIYLLGMDVFKIVWFPVLYLFFMVPWPYIVFNALAFPMQILSTKLAYGAIRFIGLEALRQGNIIHLPNYSMEVVQACSGLRSMISMSALSAIFAYLVRGTTFKRFIIFLSAIPIAIVANVFRLFITAMGAEIFGPRFAEGFLHEFSGIVVFITGLTLLFIEGGFLSWLEKRSHTGSR